MNFLPLISPSLLGKVYDLVCLEYSHRLNRMWDTEGWWIGSDKQTYEIADCFISNEEVRYCVEQGISFDDFYEWYHYDTQIHYGIDLHKPGARVVSLDKWFGLPDNQKVPLETREQWEKEYWENL